VKRDLLSSFLIAKHLCKGGIQLFTARSPAKYPSPEFSDEEIENLDARTAASLQPPLRKPKVMKRNIQTGNLRAWYFAPVFHLKISHFLSDLTKFSHFII
jgi:hypothetical protein